MTTYDANGWRATTALRFKSQGGKLLLQQMWQSEYEETEWRNVPIADAADDPAPS